MSTTTLETKWRVLFYVGECLNFEKKLVSRKTNHLKMKIMDHFGHNVQEKSEIVLVAVDYCQKMSFFSKLRYFIFSETNFIFKFKYLALQKNGFHSVSNMVVLRLHIPPVISLTNSQEMWMANPWNTIRL